MCNAICIMNQVSCIFTRHTLHVTRHTSHVTRHTSHVTRHTSHVTLFTLLFIGKQLKERKLGSTALLATIGPKHAFGHTPKQPQPAAASTPPRSPSLPASSAGHVTSPRQMQPLFDCSVMASSACTFAFLSVADLAKLDDRSRRELDVMLEQQRVDA